jgi:hypothetical protein
LTLLSPCAEESNKFFILVFAGSRAENLVSFLFVRCGRCVIRHVLFLCASWQVYDKRVLFLCVLWQVYHLLVLSLCVLWQVYHLLIPFLCVLWQVYHLRVLFLCVLCQVYHLRVLFLYGGVSARLAQHNPRAGVYWWRSYGP